MCRRRRYEACRQCVGRLRGRRRCLPFGEVCVGIVGFLGVLAILVRRFRTRGGVDALGDLDGDCRLCPRIDMGVDDGGCGGTPASFWGALPVEICFMQIWVFGLGLRFVGWREACSVWFSNSAVSMIVRCWLAGNATSTVVSLCFG